VDHQDHQALVEIVVCQVQVDHKDQEETGANLALQVPPVGKVYRVDPVLLVQLV